MSEAELREPCSTYDNQEDYKTLMRLGYKPSLTTEEKETLSRIFSREPFASRKAPFERSRVTAEKNFSDASKLGLDWRDILTKMQDDSGQGTSSPAKSTYSEQTPTAPSNSETPSAPTEHSRGFLSKFVSRWTSTSKGQPADKASSEGSSHN